MKPAEIIKRLGSLAAYGFLLVISCAWAGGNVITVNSLADPGTGACDAVQCTLREALTEAAGDGVDSTIVFEQGLTGTIVLGSQLTLTANTEILGTGPGVITLSGNNANRILFIPNNASNVTISGLTITNGNSASASGSTSGGGILVQGDQVILSNLRVVNNSAPIFGGGIDAIGSSLSVLNTEISGNTAATPGGMGWTGFGDTLLMENVTIQGNTGNQASTGLRLTTNTGDQVTLRHITVAGNLGVNTIGTGISNNNASIMVVASIFGDHEGGGNDLAAFGANTVFFNNVIESTTSIIMGSNNLIGVDPQLGPFDFQPMGAASRVYALGALSPAIDRVLVGNFGCGTDVILDQVGQIRPQLGGCDAGAWEASNAGPIAVDDMSNVVPNFSIEINVAANDFEPGGAVVPGTVAINTQPLHGLLMNNGDGTINYTPNTGFGGPSDSFTYTIMDDDGETSQPGTVTITFVPLPDPAVTIDGPAFIPFEETVTYQIMVNNLGQFAIGGLAVETFFEPRFTSVNWICSEQGGAECLTNSGSGNINQFVNMPPASSLQYTVSAIVGSTTEETDISVVATVSPSNGELELNMANNSATTTAALGIFMDGFESQ